MKASFKLTARRHQFSCSARVIIITVAVMAEEGENSLENDVRELLEDEMYQPSTSSSSLPSPSSIAERNQAFLDSLDKGKEKEDEDEYGGYIEDLDMFDEELVMMATKDLNSLLKKRNVAKPRQKDIKQRRRTLKNRYIQDE